MLEGLPIILPFSGVSGDPAAAATCPAEEISLLRAALRLGQEDKAKDELLLDRGEENVSHISTAYRVKHVALAAANVRVQQLGQDRRDARAEVAVKTASLTTALGKLTEERLKTTDLEAQLAATKEKLAHATYSLDTSAIMMSDLKVRAIHFSPAFWSGPGVYAYWRLLAQCAEAACW